MPTLMLRMWQYADSRRRSLDRYSMQAIVAALRERHLDLHRLFAQYAAANRHPATAYSEGRANRYSSAKPKRTFALRPSERSASASYRVNHLASVTTRFVPRNLKPRRTKLVLSVNMANRRTGSRAVVLVFAKSGPVTTTMVRLGKAGNGKIRVPFSSREVARVELVLVNANHTYKHCSAEIEEYSCGGVPKHDHVEEKVSARVS